MLSRYCFIVMPPGISWESCPFALSTNGTPPDRQFGTDFRSLRRAFSAPELLASRLALGSSRPDGIAGRRGHSHSRRPGGAAGYHHPCERRGRPPVTANAEFWHGG